jgi:hypothetical protein
VAVLQSPPDRQQRMQPIPAASGIRKRELPLKDMLIDFGQAGGDLN